MRIIKDLIICFVVLSLIAVEVVSMYGLINAPVKKEKSCKAYLQQELEKLP